MPDMLVKLYELPEKHELIRELEEKEIQVRRGIGPEKHIVVEWVRKNFNPHWASECDIAFSRQPVSCFIAHRGQEILGFACYDATYRNYFGPTGVTPDCRGQGIGKALLLASLHGMAEQGYAYGIIGGAGPVEFYQKTLGAMVIEGADKGIYKGMLR
ncbi:MAG: GNAT family N-acetyltransferase [Epulopiscium sp.]|nr:GNAT family N-acetyltransferase [Candidatus Epulonipiscium sp.]